MAHIKISAAPSIRRLPSYLHVVRQHRMMGGEFISGTLIARELNLEPIQVRKDLAITGITGKPKKGYPKEALIAAIEGFLGWNSPEDAVLVGVGNLGTALMGYQAFRYHGLRIIAAFDKNPHKIGSTVHGIPVLDVLTMDTQIRRSGVKIAILTVPSVSAQEAANTLTAAGIEGIWNFTNVKLKVPDQVAVQKEDLSSGYALLRVSMQTNRLIGEKWG
ncbi:MAG: redox-sensing transcriptional repressor Rex [Spirochaetaceae bacterium]|jgi:redox-sensing transcriptional repressor|nr:redox-sensing transcriptional repressor Rex [Spirochaetaceae bacterium]